MRPDCFELANLEPGQFRDLRHRGIWAAIGELRSRGAAIDEVTVHAHLESQGAKAITLAYLGELALIVPTPAHVESYAEAIRQEALTRSLLEGLSDIATRIKSRAVHGGDALSEAFEALSRVDVGRRDATVDIGDLVRAEVAALEKLAGAKAAGERVLSGYPTGVRALDENLGGVQPGICTVVAARPRMGKSSFALGIADACSDAGVGVHVFSAEDSAQSYAHRTLSRLARVDAEKMRSLEFNREDMSSLGRAIAKAHQRRGWKVDPTHGMTPDEVVRDVRRHRRDNGTKVVIVDYINRLKLGGAKERHDQIRIGFETLCNAAAQDNLAYVVLAQLNRGLESRVDKTPTLSDLKDSGALEEYAKCVLALIRDSVYDAAADPSVIRLLVLKNSNGPEFALEARWDGPTMTIR